MTSRTRSGGNRVRRELRIFVGVGLLALLAIAAGSVFVIEEVAQQQALHEDERSASRIAELVVAPLLEPALAGFAQPREQLDRVVAARIRDGSLAEVDIWSADGEILYSDDASTIGRRLPPSEEVLDAILRGRTSSDVTDEPETGRASDPMLVEVYVPLRLSDRVVAFEAYFSYRSVQEQAALLTGQLVPLAVGGLVLLQLVQIPIAVSLSRRVRRHEAERARLLEQALSASERERKEIAAGLHDGVVQDLAGVGYAIGALSRLVPAENREIADRLGTTVRGAVDALRRLMVDIYPPDLSGSGLAAAVTGLAQPVRAAGIGVQVDIAPLPALDPAVAAALYRTARETLANVLKHAQASEVTVSLGPDDAGRVQLRVCDDGIGPPAQVFGRADGHMGLQILLDRIGELGGELTIAPGPSGGTVAEARLPAVAGPPATSGQPRNRGVRRSPTGGSPTNPQAAKLDIETPTRGNRCPDPTAPASASGSGPDRDGAQQRSSAF